MNFIAIITVVALIIMGVFHFYWAFGGKVALDKALPTKDGKRLINPGRLLTFTVGILLLWFAFVAYSLEFSDLNSNYYVYAGWMLSGIFFLRAVGDFNAVGFFKKIKSTEFAKYDTRYFSPLCLSLSAVFALLSYQI